MRVGIRFLLLPLACLYFVLVRYFASADGFWLYLDIILFAAITVPILAFLQHRRLPTATAKALQLTLWWQSLVVIAMIAHAIGIAFQFELMMIWLLAALLGISVAVGMEWSLGSSRPHYHYAQVKRIGALSGAVGLTLALLANGNYLAVRHNIAHDFSYLRVTKVSPTTQKLAAQLADALHVYLFFRADDEPLAYVRSYLTQLVGGKEIAVTLVDKDFRPALAKKYRVYENGDIVFAYTPAAPTATSKSERVYISDDMRIARSKIRNLDALVQRALLRIQAKPRAVYFWQGHGEFSWDYREQPPRSLRHWRALLLKQNFHVRRLSLAGAQGIPTDAELVVIAAPMHGFTLLEVAALRDYLERGGKAIVLLDPDAEATSIAEQPLLEFLRHELGIAFHAQVLADDRTYVAARKSSIDRWYVLTNNFADHPATMSVAANKAHVIFFQSGYLTLPQAAERPQKRWQTQMLVESLATTFIDHNRNFAYDAQTEQRDKYGQCVVAEDSQQQGKVFACADATVASDPLLQNIGNRLLLVDSVRWLLADDELGLSGSEVDVKITHSNDKDMLLFYGTIVIAPCLLLFIGFWVSRLSGRRD